MVAAGFALTLGATQLRWNAYGDYGTATMQLKHSPMVASLAVIALIMAPPALESKCKVFIGFYHHDDERRKEEIERLFGDRVIGKSVWAEEYDPDDSDEYVKRHLR